MFIHPELPRIRFLRFWFTCVEYLPAICGVFPCRLGSLWSSGQQSHVSFEAVDFGVAHSVNFTVALRSPIIKLFGAQTLLATQAGIRSELAVVRESSETWPPFMATETNRMPSLVYASWILLYTGSGWEQRKTQKIPRHQSVSRTARCVRCAQSSGCIPFHRVLPATDRHNGPVVESRFPLVQRLMEKYFQTCLHSFSNPAGDRCKCVFQKGLVPKRVSRA